MVRASVIVRVDEQLWLLLLGECPPITPLESDGDSERPFALRGAGVLDDFLL